MILKGLDFSIKFIKKVVLQQPFPIACGLFNKGDNIET